MSGSHRRTGSPVCPYRGYANWQLGAFYGILPLNL